jgi:NDP-sugar pyrophosphorylase family protein
MNGDILTDLDFVDLCRHHRQSGCRFTVAAATRRHQIDYGVLKVDANRLVGFEEKPAVEYRVSMGVYVVNRDVLSLVPPDTAYSFDTLMLELLRRNDPVNIYAHQGYWLDIGRPDDYAQAVEEFTEMEPRLLAHG